MAVPEKLDLDGLDADGIDLPFDGSLESLTAGHGITEIGASCDCFGGGCSSCSCSCSVVARDENSI